ncbi:type IX secretion system protein PorQ [Riemerella columbina]|uniref:type IX secretion system protein PorQ n=1 Tax=Riemerella columbina TaxID=103810 RepID=UPI00266EBD56|nr:type IX secretion system protein PorQ [Riemerella columbina]WKS94411.1 type IX secretion system protein PorQ [Riemerella columbina]
MKKGIFLLGFFLSGWLGAQDGTTVYHFLNLPVSARQAALGDAVSVRDYDQNFATVNPALLNIEMDNRLSVNYASYLAGSHYGTISYAKDLEYGHFLTAGAKYLDYGSIPRTDEYGNIHGDFSAIDAAVGVGYAYQFTDDWTVGAQVNLITSKIEHYQSMAVAGNIGAAYHRKKAKETISFVVRNLGYQFKTYNGARESLPVRVDLGYTKILDEFPLALTITAHDLQKWNISPEYNQNGQKTKWTKQLADHFSFGAELFPEQAFNLRVGYHVKRGSELSVTDQRSFTGLSFGFGFKWSYLRFDYTHSRYHNASNLNQIGIALDLIEVRGYRR